MSAILGGLFNSRLNMKLREEKGYTYGAGAGFDMRRGAGPFSARAAVNTEVTVPAIQSTCSPSSTRIRDEPVAASELAAARDFLIGVFPLRFETAGAVVGALGSLAVHGLSVDELVGYRAHIEAVDAAAVRGGGSEHILLDEAVDRARRRRGRVRRGPRGGRPGPDRDRARRGRRAPPGPEAETETPGPVDDDERDGSDRRRRGTRAQPGDRRRDAPTRQRPRYDQGLRRPAPSRNAPPDVAETFSLPLSQGSRDRSTRPAHDGRRPSDAKRCPSGSRPCGRTGDACSWSAARRSLPTA